MESANQGGRRRLSRPASTSSLRTPWARGLTNAQRDLATNATNASSEVELTPPSDPSPRDESNSALDTAHQRLQHIRDSLRDMDPDVALATQLLTSGRATIGPAHAAIVLSDNDNDAATPAEVFPDMNDPLEAATISPHLQNMLSIVRSNRTSGQSRLELANEAIGRLRSALDAITSDHSPSGPLSDSTRRLLLPPSLLASQQPGGLSSAQLLPLARRRSLLEMHLRRHLSRPDNSDDGSTSLGRQVTARAAAGRGQSSIPGSTWNSPFTAVRLRPPYPELVPQPVYSDETDTTPSPGFSRRRRGALPPFEPPSAGSDSDSSVTTMEASAGPTAAPPYPDRQSTGTTTRRRVRGAAAALMGRSRSWERSDTATGGAPVRSEVVEADPAESRSYRVRRRLNSDGEEHVHQIRMEDLWDGDEEDPNEWLVPTRDRLRPTTASASRMRRNMDSVLLSHRWTPGERGPRLARAQVIPGRDAPSTAPAPVVENVSGTSRRRRGWARLNADGDEIPTEEEEELERIRTERRARRANPVNSESGVPRRARLEYLVPTTRTAFSYGTDDEAGTRPVRMNLPSIRRRSEGAEAAAPQCSRDGDDEESGQPKVFGTAVPYYIDPLPMPLEQMLPSPPSLRSLYREHEPRQVSRQAEMAAR